MRSAIVKTRNGAEFVNNVLIYINATNGYEWGKESITGADCSGTVCGPLMLMGWHIRGTADDLYNKIFTDVSAINDKFTDIPMAVFYVSEVEWEKLSGTKMPIGTVRHVTPVVGYDVVCHADYNHDHIRLYTADTVRKMYERKGCRAVLRQISWANMIKWNNTLYYSPDF